MKRLIHILLITTLSFCLILSGCSKKEKQKPELETNYPILQYIPADTPYVIAGLEPLPEKLQIKFSEFYDEIFKLYFDIGRTAYQDHLDDKKEIHAENNWIKALEKEFDDDFTFDSLKRYGFDMNSTYALYGHGVLPVMRLGLSDTDLFKQSVARIETEANDKIPQLNVADMSVWAISPKDDEENIGQLVFAVDAHDLIVTFLPKDASVDMLKQLLGAQKPVSSLANSPTVSDLMQEKSYLPQSLGFIDFRQILNRFTSELNSVDKELFTKLNPEFKQKDLSPICRSELEGIVDNAPRLVFGLTGIDDKSMTTESVFEVKPKWATEMINLTAPVPGLGDAAGFFSMGMSFDIPALRDLSVKVINTLKENPYTCDFLAIEESSLDKALASVNNPAAGFVESIHGFNIVIDDLDADAIFEIIKAQKSNEGELNFSDMQELFSEKFSAHAVMAAENPKTLINMAKMFSPEIASLDLKADEKPILLNEIFPEPLPMDVYVAMNNEALAFTLGKEAEKNTKKILKHTARKNPPMFSYSVDMSQYLKIFDAMMSDPELAAEMEKEGEMTPEELRVFLNTVLGMFGTVTSNVGFREDGVVFDQKITFNNE